MTPRRCDLSWGSGFGAASEADFREGFAPAPGLTRAGRQATVTPPPSGGFTGPSKVVQLLRGAQMRLHLIAPWIEASRRDISRCCVRPIVSDQTFLSQILRTATLRDKIGYILTRLVLVASHLRPWTRPPGNYTLI